MTEKAQMSRSYTENKREIFHVGNTRISSSSNIESNCNQFAKIFCMESNTKKQAYDWNK